MSSIKRVVTVALLAAAPIAISAGTASAGAVDDAKRAVSNALYVPSGSHDVCIGTLDSEGHQHPWLCINGPQTL